MPTSDESVFNVSHEEPPRVILWFKVYTAFLAFIYLSCACASLIFLFVDPVELEMDAVVARALGAVLLVMGLSLFAACLVPLIARPRPWVWIYDLIIICLGMTSACFWPAVIPLLIFWLKPETKRHFAFRRC